MFKKQQLPQKVEFRWRQHEEEWCQRFVESAKAADQSFGDHARELVKKALTVDEELSHDIQRLRDEVAAIPQQLDDLVQLKRAVATIHDTVCQLRNDLATAVPKLLVDAGKMPQDKARWWTRQALNAD